MKYVIKFMLAVVFAVAAVMPFGGNAEAATVALLPLINNVEGNTTAGQIYFDKGLNAIKAQKGFSLVDNDKLTAAIDKYTTNGVLPTEDALKKIAKDGEVDIVIAMELNTLNDKKLVFGNGDLLQLDLTGKVAAYNALTGQFMPHKIYNDSQIDEALTSRWDWKSEEWGRTVTREVNRALQVKKISVQAPRMSHL